MRTATIAFPHHAAVPCTEAEALAFIGGEVPPAIAERFVPHGMPVRGLIRYRMEITEAPPEGLRIVEALCRRAFTLSSALPRVTPR